jgi:polyhydroxybutyrate depolymerase
MHIICNGLVSATIIILLTVNGILERNSATFAQQDLALSNVPDYHHLAFTHHHQRRSYYLHWPFGYPAQLQQRIPLLIFLHGGGVPASSAMQETKLHEFADRDGFCVVFPQMLTTERKEYQTWNLGRCCGEAHEDHVDDIGFIRTLLDHLKSEYPIDPQRIYIAGMSNGGMLAIRLGILLSKDIAAVASIHGAMFGDESWPDQPISIMMMQGTGDHLIPYLGGPSKSKNHQYAMDGFFLSVFDVLKFWGKSNRCQDPVAVFYEGDMEKLSYQNCADKVDTVLYLIHGGFHAWSGKSTTATLSVSSVEEAGEHGYLRQEGHSWLAEPIPTSEILVKFLLKQRKELNVEK